MEIGQHGPGGLPPWLAGGGAVGALIAGRDWSDSPLGPLARWPASLRGALGTVLGSPVAMTLMWGESGILLYNEAYARFAGGRHPRALGMPVLQAWPEARSLDRHLLRALLHGECASCRDLAVLLARGDGPERLYLDVDYSPVVGDDGRPAGVLAVLVETTARVAAERRLRFRLELEHRLQGLDDPRAILHTAVHALGRHLRASRVGYSQLRADDRTIACECCYTDGVVAVCGVFDLDGFGAASAERQRRGLVEVCEDVLEDADQAGVLDVWASLQTRAFVSVPLLRDGQLKATLYANSREPRRWTDEEVTLIRDVATRTWDAVERAAAEQASRDSEDRFRMLAELSPDALIIVHQERIVYANAAAVRLYGMDSVAELRGCPPTAFIPPADRLRVHERITRLLAGEAVEPTALTILRQDGSRVPVEVSATRVPWEGGHALEVLLRDATERRMAETALRELNETLEQQVAERTAELQANQARMRAAFETSYIFQGLMSPDGILLDTNTTSLQAIGRLREQVLGRPFWDTPWFSDTPGMRQCMRAAIERVRQGEPFRQEVRLRLPAGWRWFDFSMRPIHNHLGSIVAIVPEAVETTERRQAEEALRQSQKLEAMGQLTGGVAHDFNNLLTPILGGLDMLQRSGMGGTRERRLIDGALQAAERARTLVHRLLAFARRQPLRARAVDLAGLIAGMGALMASTVGPKIHLDVRIDPALPPAHADPNQLEMALLNLAVNARDAMPEGGTLTLQAQLRQLAGPRAALAPGRYLCLAVSDTGRGMDPATLARAVEPFFSTKGLGRGTGLGLSMVHGLLSQLGGEMILQSTPDRGTRIELWLPVSTEQVGQVTPVPGAPCPAGSRTVLLVDDEAEVRRSTAAMLDDLGLAVVEASCADQALALLEGNLAPDLLLTDHLMPGMSGTELAAAARTRWPGLPVLLVSGYAELEGISSGLAHLTKPFRRQDLAAALGRVLADVAA